MYVELAKALSEYQPNTHLTAIYPREHALSYLLMGLMAEVSEFGNSETREDAIKELGDLFWFTSELATLINADLSTLYQASPGINELGEAWRPPKGDVIAMAIFSNEVMDIQGVAAKHLRDGTPYEDEMSLFLTRALRTWETIADAMGADAVPLLYDNLAKLQSRQRRGVLGGSGDNR